VLTSAELSQLHFERTGRQARVFRAPGRVNLVGEHTDYAGGFCMPAALNFSTLAGVSSRADARLVVHSVDLDETVEYDLTAMPERGSGLWADYVAGVARELMTKGIRLRGADVTLAGDVPRNAGLSSSASLEVAAATALLGVSDGELSGREIALLCQRAENNFVGAPCGIMDQFVSVHGRAGDALVFDCWSLDYEYVTLPAHLRLVIANSMVKHSVAGGEYRERRTQVEEGTRLLAAIYPGVRLLRDVTLAQLEAARAALPDLIYRRCRHVISDSGRVLAAQDFLKRGDVFGFGRLLIEAHASYRDDFGASCAECDTLVDLAIGLRGCYGSRLTGGGFGGCTVSVVEAAEAENFRDALREKYFRATGISADIWICEIGDGAREIFV
jgi:galactokinase